MRSDSRAHIRMVSTALNADCEACKHQRLSRDAGNVCDHLDSMDRLAGADTFGMRSSRWDGGSAATLRRVRQLSFAP